MALEASSQDNLQIAGDTSPQNPTEQPCMQLAEHTNLRASFPAFPCQDCKFSPLYFILNFEIISDLQKNCKNSTFLHILHLDSSNVNIFTICFFIVFPGACGHAYTPPPRFSESCESKSQTCNFTPTYFSVYFVKTMLLSYLTIL